MKLILVTFTIAACTVGTVGSAGAFPDRTVRIVVPFAPGGVTDLAARFLGQQLAVRWKKSVVIENKTGGAGLIGMDAVANAEADGHTLLMATNGEMVVKPAISVKMPYDPAKVFTSIAVVASTPYAWASHSKSGINSLADLVAAARSKPDALSYSSAGYGSTMHMASEQFAAAVGVKMLHVPYRGGAPAAAAVISGEVPVGLVGTNSVAPVTGSGTAKLLAVTSTSRVRIIPDVPTISETGIAKGFEATVWAGLYAPRGTPAGIVAKIQADVAEALKDPALLEKFETMGMEVGRSFGADLDARVKSEIEAMAQIAKNAKIQLD